MNTADLKKNSYILSHIEDELPHLSPNHQNDITGILHKYPNVSSDKPGLVRSVEHDIELMPNVQPIHQAPYRLNLHKLEIMKKEVDYFIKIWLKWTEYVKLVILVK